MDPRLLPSIYGPRASPSMNRMEKTRFVIYGSRTRLVRGIYLLLTQ